MPGRSSNSANPNDNYKFTGYEEDDEAGLTMYHANARGYDPVLGRFMQIDPMSHLYPGISPFAYAMNNPLLYIDPTGETVECSTKEDCDRAASDINEAHEGAGVEVLEKTRDVKNFWGKKTGEETYYELTTGNKDFDWSNGGTDKYGAAVFDVLASQDVTFTVVYTMGEIPAYGRPNIQGYRGGFFDEDDVGGSSGGTVYIDPRGNLKSGEPSSVILMHELIGHGHPIGGGPGVYHVNNHYNNKLGINPKGGRYDPNQIGFRGNSRMNSYNNNLMLRIHINKAIENLYK